MSQQKIHSFRLGPNGHATVGTSGFSFYTKGEDGSPILISVQDVPEELMRALSRAIPKAFKNDEKIRAILER